MTSEINISAELTVEDLDILITGVDSWARRHEATEILQEVMSAAIAGQDQRLQQDMKRRIDQERNKKQVERSDDADTATMLKAKLILMKRRLLRSR